MQASHSGLGSVEISNFFIGFDWFFPNGDGLLPLLPSR